MSASESDNKSSWLWRVPEVFEPWRDEILAGVDAQVIRLVGKDYVLVHTPAGASLPAPSSKFISWRLPVGHLWPCNPRRIDGFIEKAAQALLRKFAPLPVQALLVGALEAGGDRHFRSLASNLRGRALQLFGEVRPGLCEAGAQDPSLPSLFVLVGREGLFAGVSTPLEAGGFFPGGTRFIKQSGPAAISRAGAKVAEALHYLRLFRDDPREGAHWLELGASPGGMTSELLARGFRVTAVDRAPLDPRLTAARGLQVVTADAGDFEPPHGTVYDAILSDMNGDALSSFSHVLRFVPRLKSGGLVMFTLKLAAAESVAAVDALELEILEMAARAGLDRIACRHLTYNRMEFTCLFGNRPA